MLSILNSIQSLTGQLRFMSHTSVRTLVHHFGSNIGPATAGPAIPAPAPLGDGCMGKERSEVREIERRGRWEKEKQGKRKRGEREERRLKYIHVHAIG